MKTKRGLIYCSFLILFAISAPVSAKTLTAEKVMENVVRVFEPVNDFVVSIEAEVQMERIQVPHMKAVLYFKKPDKVHFSSQAFLMVPREGIVLNPANLRNNYDAVIVQEEKNDTSKFIKLQLAAKNASVRVRQLSVWVDPSNWTIVKMETVPYSGRTLTLLFTYALQENTYWLPEKVVASFGAQTESPEGKNDLLEMKTQALSDEHQRPAPRGGSVSVTYSGYKINAGIDDAVFEKKEEGKR
jgi:outer membrane lipoprotein-sorting protein